MSARSKKGKKVHDKAEKEYKLISGDELRARELKYNNRLLDLQVCLQILYDAVMEVDDFDDEKRGLRKWKKYLACDGLPKPYMPPDIRTFFVKLRHFEAEAVEKGMDWELAVDERSILSQDIDNKDLTRRTLQDEIRPIHGKQYENDIHLSLKVLESMDYYINDEKMVAKATSRVLEDIFEQRHEVQKEICEFFDRFTYRIICAENSLMDTVDAITSEYTYEAEDFAIHIWALKDVPIRFAYRDELDMTAYLHKLNVIVKIPFVILEPNLTLRGLHVKFDHFSEHAKSYEQKITAPTENFNAGITDLHRCVMNEWNMQVDLITEVRNMMIQKRYDYEEKQRLAEEEEARIAKERKKGGDENKKSKKKKEPTKKKGKEPHSLTPDEFPDVFEDFLLKEHRQYLDFLNGVYHPTKLNLTDDEVNLKQYFILGGVYQLHFVDKPKQTNFQSFKMTWHAGKRNLKTRNDVHIDAHKNDVASSGSSQHSTYANAAVTNAQSFHSKTDLHASQSRGFGDKSDVPSLFVVTFELPDYLCLWGEPIPCHFEGNVIGFVEEIVEEAAAPQPPSTSNPLSSLVPHTDHDMDSDHMSVITGLSNYNLTRMTSTFTPASVSVTNFFQPTLSATSFTSSGTRIPRYRIALDVEDFLLDFPLTKNQIRHLQRHCLPRLISSYRFPREFQEEGQNDDNAAGKGKGTLIRKRLSADETTKVKETKRVFTYENQYVAERLFPIFPPKEPLFIALKADNMLDTLRATEPRTFLELIDTLNTIKNEYKQKYENTVKVQFVKAPVKRKTPAQLINPLAVIPQTMVHMSTAEEGEGEDLDSQVKKDGPKERKSVEVKRKSSIGGGKRKSSGASTKRKSAVSVRPSLFEAKVDEGTHSSEKDEEKVEEAEEGENEEGEDAEEGDDALLGEEEQEVVDLRKTFTFSHWTKGHIFHSIFDREKRRITVWTDRLGTMGFAYKRYVHFPFRFWSVEPSAENPDKEVVLTIETQHVKCVLFVTGDGYRGYVTDATKKFLRHRPMYLVIDKPTTDFMKLKKLFRERNLNIFSDHDALFYIDAGYFSEKHVAAELHTYACMAVNCFAMKYGHSGWNRLAKRRDILLRLAESKESDESLIEVRVTPEEATFVEVKELCSDDLDVIKLEYTPTWRNIEHYSDLHHLITSINAAAVDQRCKDPRLICCLKNILCEIRPLSYS